MQMSILKESIKYVFFLHVFVTFSTKETVQENSNVVLMTISRTPETLHFLLQQNIFNLRLHTSIEKSRKSINYD